MVGRCKRHSRKKIRHLASATVIFLHVRTLVWLNGRMDQVDIRGSRFNFTGLTLLAGAVGICLIIITCVGAYWFVFGRPIEKGVDLWAKLVTIQPEVRIDQRTIISQGTNILELATAQKEINVRFDYEFRYGTSKRIEVESAYLVKAGFDLNERFVLDIDTSNKTVIATLPRPVVLSVMRRHALDTRETDSILNRLTADEREMAINALDTQAKRQARHSGIHDDARKFLEAKLNEAAVSAGMKLTIVYADSPKRPDEPILKRND